MDYIGCSKGTPSPLARTFALVMNVPILGLCIKTMISYSAFGSIYPWVPLAMVSALVNIAFGFYVVSKVRRTHSDGVASSPGGQATTMKVSAAAKKVDCDVRNSSEYPCDVVVVVVVEEGCGKVGTAVVVARAAGAGAIVVAAAYILFYGWLIAEKVMLSLASYKIHNACWNSYDWESCDGSAVLCSILLSVVILGSCYMGLLPVVAFITLRTHYCRSLGCRCCREDTDDAFGPAGGAGPSATALPPPLLLAQRNDVSTLINDGDGYLPNTVMTGTEVPAAVCPQPIPPAAHL